MKLFPILMLALLMVVLAIDAKPATTSGKSSVKAAPVKTDSKAATKAKSTGKTVAAGKASSGASKSDAAAKSGAAKSGATKSGAAKSGATKSGASKSAAPKANAGPSSAAKTSIAKPVGAIKVNTAEVAMPADGVFFRPTPSEGESPIPSFLPPFSFPIPNFVQSVELKPFQNLDQVDNMGDNTVKTLLPDGSMAYVLGGVPSNSLNGQGEQGINVFSAQGGFGGAGFGGGGFGGAGFGGAGFGGAGFGGAGFGGGGFSNAIEPGVGSVQQDTQSDGIVSGQVIGAIDPVRGGAMGFQPGNGWSMG